LSARAKLWVALWTVYIIWGSTYLGIERTVETIPPIFAVAVRFVIAGSLIGAFVAWRRGFGALRMSRTELAAGALVGLLLPGSNGLLFIAERTVPTGLSSLIIASVPLWVVLMRLTMRDRPATVTLGGVALGLVGVGLLVRPGGHGGHLGGIVLVVLSAMGWAAGSFLSSRLPLPRDPFAATSIEMVAGGLAMLPVSLFMYSWHDLSPAQYSARSIGGFWYLVVFGSIVGYSAYSWLLANAPISQVATYAYVNPVIAVALGVLVLHEHLSATMAIGATLILASVAIVVRRESGDPAAAREEAPQPVAPVADESYARSP
jgi:drug/metabolite transporter (DMT)-like permease